MEKQPSTSTVEAFRRAGSTIHAAGRDMAINITRFALRMHAPIEAEPGVPVCARCRKYPAWPCKETLRLTESLDRLLAEKNR